MVDQDDQTSADAGRASGTGRSSAQSSTSDRDTTSERDSTSADVTDLLRQWTRSDSQTEERLLKAIYGELSRLAKGMFERERSDHTLEPSALVHEAYLRLIQQHKVNWQNRAHFYRLATTMMRRVLVDYGRGRQRAKRGGGAVKVSLDWDPGVEREASIEQLDDALRELAKIDSRRASLVELRFFAGLSVADTALALGCSPRTVAKEWTLARAWLTRELSRSTT